jgi:predicted CxxxxCH...CXXCH cytochrome family protein
MKGGVYTYGTLQGNDNGFNWSNGSTTCNTTYCHSNGAGASGYATVAWNGATTGCTACHGDATTAGKLLNTGAHQQHVNNSGYLGSNFGCVDCHAKTVSTNTTLADKRLHVNKFVEYSGLRAGKQINFNKTTGVCSGIYCHSDGKGNAVATPAWTATALPTGLACNGCHANTSPSHPSHVVTHGITCDMCHSNTAASNTALKAAPNAHINGTYNVNGTDVKFATFSSAWKATYASTGKTCSTVYCHSDGHGGYQTVTWGATLNCNSCHPFATLSAGHAKHIDLNQTAVFYTYTANRSSGDEGLSNAVYRFGCSNCHPVDEAAFHGNGVIDVTLKPVAGAGSLKNKNINITADGINVAGSHVFKTGNTLTCDNVYCHTNGYATSTNWSNVTPAWTGTFANADRCANCHGNSPSVGIAGSPAHAAHVVGIHSDDIFTGTTGKLAAGRGGAFGNTTSVSHGSSVQATTINCNICHNTTVTYARNDRNSSCSTTGCHTTFTKLAQINNRANHVNGKVELAFAGVAVKSKAQLRDSAFADYTAAGGSWTRSSYKAGAASFDTAKRALSNTMYSGGNCSNIACHNGRPVNWTSDVGKGKDCTICHSRL